MSKEDPIPTYEQSVDALNNDKEEIIKKAIFPFKYYDGEYVTQVTEAIRHLLTRPDLTPAQIVSVGRALHGLSRLPLRTPGLQIQISLTIVNPSGGETYTFEISEKEFITESSGYVNLGNDSGSFSGPSLIVDTLGRDEDGTSFPGISWPDAFKDMSSANLKIQDDSSDELLDWKHSDGSAFWEWIAKHD